VIVDLGKVEAVLPAQEQIPGEVYQSFERIKTYVVEVKKTTKGPQIMLSRTHPGLIKRLFELEVPEIHDGIVEIKGVSREAGARSKIAVYSRDSNVDPVGACVGPKGVRVQTIVTELKGEKIDIVNYSTDPQEFVANALSPAKVVGVYPKLNEKVAVVVVPDYQLSLAIGKEGQNARLAAKLTGWKIDIKSESQAGTLNIIPQVLEEGYETYDDYEEYSDYDEFVETDDYQEYDESGQSNENGHTLGNEENVKNEIYQAYDENYAYNNNEVYDAEFSENEATHTVTDGVQEKAPREIEKDLKADEKVSAKEKKKKGKG
jgi:N utilization substance protein A